VPFADPRFPVVANAAGAAVRTAADARALLARQLTTPVRWVECVQRLWTLAAGKAVTFLELGPGNVLAGLMKRVEPAAAAASVGSADEVARFLAAA
jgi:[acyl-carrier-protein] S-malonyltransferase